MAYAPHYYNPTTIVFRRWYGLTATMDNAFRHMTAKRAEWDAPLFVGEFGMDSRVVGSGDYVDAVYDRLDAQLASGAQWNLTPGWTPTRKDGWNGEDFTILDPAGRLRPNFRPRPYPRATAGIPVRFAFRRADSASGASTLEFDWRHRPDLGVTEVFVPASVFPPGSAVEVRPSDPSAVVSVWRDDAGQRLLVRSDRPTGLSLRAWSRRSDDRAEEVQRPLQAVGAVDLGLPAEELAGPGDVGAAALGVVLGQGAVVDGAPGAGDHRDDLLGELQHGDLRGVADVDRHRFVGEEQAIDAVDQVGRRSRSCGSAALRRRRSGARRGGPGS